MLEVEVKKTYIPYITVDGATITLGEYTEDEMREVVLTQLIGIIEEFKQETGKGEKKAEQKKEDDKEEIIPEKEEKKGEEKPAVKPAKKEKQEVKEVKKAKESKGTPEEVVFTTSIPERLQEKAVKTPKVKEDVKLHPSGLPEKDVMIIMNSLERTSTVWAAAGRYGDLAKLKQQAAYQRIKKFQHWLEDYKNGFHTAGNI